VDRTAGLGEAGEEGTRTFHDLHPIDRRRVVEHPGKRLALAVAVILVLPESPDLVGVVVVGLILAADVGDTTHVVGRIGERQGTDVGKKLAREHLHGAGEVAQTDVGARARQRVGCHPAVVIVGDIELGERHDVFLAGRGGRWRGRAGKRRLRARDGHDERGKQPISNEVEKAVLGFQG
jgi:hypothetical protein